MVTNCFEVHTVISELAGTGSTLFSGRLFLEADSPFVQLSHYFLADCFRGRQSISSNLVVSSAQLSFFVKIELTYFLIPSLMLDQYHFIVGWNLHL